MPANVKVVDQSHELLIPTDMNKHIEAAGRTCYKSEDKITDTSAARFVELMMKSGHHSVIEHGWACFIVFSNTVFQECETYPYLQCYGTHVSGNYRAWYEAAEKSLLIRRFFLSHLIKLAPAIFGKMAPIYDVKDMEVCKLIPLEWFVKPDFLIPSERKYLGFITVRVLTDRGITHELVRHRPASFSQESTRYVGYGGKHEYKIIRPVWCSTHLGNPHEMHTDEELIFLQSMDSAFQDYEKLRKLGWKPEQARQVLPNALASEIVITATAAEWEHIFRLRVHKAAHPQVRSLMTGVLKDFAIYDSEIFVPIMTQLLGQKD